MTCARSAGVSSASTHALAFRAFLGHYPMPLATYFARRKAVLDCKGSAGVSGSPQVSAEVERPQNAAFAKV